MNPRLTMLALTLAMGCATTATTSGGRVGGGTPVAAGTVLDGQASYYADSLRGNPTANGDLYDPGALTAAHRTLPFGTRLRVRRLDNDRRVEVRVNDRGPFGHASRIIDLSRAAAQALDMIRAGVVDVEVEVLSVPASRSRSR